MGASRTTRQKIALFQSCFSGLANVYGTYDPKTSKVRQVKERVTGKVLLHHLQGKQPYGVYLLVGDQTGAVAVDFDEEDVLPPVKFIQRARHYGVHAYLERSKSKGWHVWVFMEFPAVAAAKARRVMATILTDIDTPDTEIFPKQDRLGKGTFYGNFINAPLFGVLVPEGRTVFVDPDQNFIPYSNQWDFLESIRRVSESQLDEILEINGQSQSEDEVYRKIGTNKNSFDQNTFGLPPCARNMLKTGVVEYQRVACFRLALHLKKAGIPQDVAVVALEAWANKNRPRNGKRILTISEITQQTEYAYAREYRGCGCEEPAVKPYCHPHACPLRAPRPNRNPPDQRQFI